MIDSLAISGYRGIESLKMSGLGRINLLVGTNNSGKTSVLEALYLLASGGDLTALWRILTARGEWPAEDQPDRRPEREVDVRHMFHGHKLEVGAKLSVVSKENGNEREINISVRELTADSALRISEIDDDIPIGQILVLSFSGRPTPTVPSVPLSSRGSFSSRVMSLRRMRSDANNNQRPVQYVPTSSLSPRELLSLWSSIALTDGEDRVLNALKTIDAKIDRIAAIPSPGYYLDAASRGGFRVKIAGTDAPLPIGSLGDGVWRLLAVAIALSQAKDGVLLIDEIDTGLHYTEMEKMWTLVAQTAKDLNVQVFATTHSRDCVTSLAAICRSEVESGSEVTIQRIEPGREHAVPYSEAEIIVAAEHHIEVR